MIDCEVDDKTKTATKDYQPPQGLPFASTGSYETDREAYLKRREPLYQKNTIALRRTTKTVLRAIKGGVPSNEAGKEEDGIYKERKNLADLDRFFDIVDEC